jgi:transposase-like protein
LERRSTPASGAVEPGSEPDPEARPTRRRFTADFKRRILREADACEEPGSIGRLLRREGLYSSHLTDWRREFESGGLQALVEKPRGRKPQPASEQQDRVAQLEREKAQLEARLKQAELIIDVQKKVSRALDLALHGKNE